MCTEFAKHFGNKRLFEMSLSCVATKRCMQDTSVSEVQIDIHRTISVLVYQKEPIMKDLVTRAVSHAEW